MSTIISYLSIAATALSIIGLFWKQGKDYGSTQNEIKQLKDVFDDEKKNTDKKLDELYQGRLESVQSQARMSEALNSLKVQLSEIKADVSRTNDKLDVVMKELIKGA